jgi:hypothetical protein
MRRVIVTAGPSVRELEEQFFFNVMRTTAVQCEDSNVTHPHSGSHIHSFFSLDVCGWCVFYEKSPAGLIVDGYGAVPHERLSDLFSCIYMCNFFLCWALSLSTLSYFILLTSTPPAHPLTWPVLPLTNTHGHKTPSAKPTVNGI